MERPAACPDCGAPFWLVFENLEPISGLIVGEVACLGCDEGRIYMLKSEHAPLEPDDSD